MWKFGWFAGVIGHRMSAAMLPFHRPHTTFYSTLIETVRLTCAVFRDITGYLSKVVDFNLPHLHLARPLGDPVRISRRSGLYHGVVSVILCLAVLIQHGRVTDRQTHTRTHDDG